ncbi:MAG: four helix bundle protein [Planctomycetales bacterium]|nr:four helix bundle protein [Planctomycetales bacterium]
MAEGFAFQFENLHLYQKSLDAIDKVYRYTDSFPREEMYGITSQFRRAVVSVTLNTAEGSARSKKDFRRFLDMTQGSIYECIALLTVCKRRNYINEESFSQLRLTFLELSKMTCGLKRGIGFPDRNDS